MLGLPLGTVDITSLPLGHDHDKIVKTWKKQFTEEKDIRPRGIQRAISRLTDIGLMFRVNVFVLICNTLSKSKSMGTCDLSMLDKVSHDLDLSDIDWCSYVLHCLKDTKDPWNPLSDTSYYVGSIIFLTLLYLEHVRFDAVTVERGRPALCYWNVDKLREREQMEQRNDGFGMGELQEPFIPQNSNYQNVDCKIESDQNANDQKVDSIRGCEPLEDTHLELVTCDEHKCLFIPPNATDQHVDSDTESVLLYLSNIYELFNKLVVSKIDLELKLNEAIGKHPMNISLQEWNTKVKEFFLQQCPHTVNNDFPDDPIHDPLQSQWWSDNAEVLSQCLVMASNSGKMVHNSPLPNRIIRLTKEMANIIYSSPLKNVSITPVNLFASPLPLSIVQAVKEPVVAEERQKRQTFKAGYLRSPYIVRCVDVSQAVSRADRALSEWVFSSQGDPSDIIFETLAGVYAQRFHLESFYTDCELFGHVIDCWSHLLNFQEDLQSDLSSRRSFAPTTVTLFLPVVRQFHIFLFVIDCRQPSFLIIDNIKSDASLEERYGVLPELVATVNKSTDCGVFTIRHMETFMGGSMNDFQPGFKAKYNLEN